MSLTVPPEVVARAERGELSPEAFVEVIRTSLPYFHARVGQLAAGVEQGGFAVSDDEPATEEEWGQLLRGFASDPIRRAMERHHGVTLGFRNCCFTAATRPGAEGEERWSELFTPQAQILAQRPSLVNC